jgi:hypothetical protein
MKIKLLALLLATLAISVNAKEIASVDNKNGGVTILTDVVCPISDDYLYGLATGTKVPTVTFCWGIDHDDVVLYLPLNKSVKVPLNVFEKPNQAKEAKPFTAI